MTKNKKSKVNLVLFSCQVLQHYFLYCNKLIHNTIENRQKGIFDQMLILVFTIFMKTIYLPYIVGPWTILWYFIFMKNKLFLVLSKIAVTRCRKKDSGFPKKKIEDTKDTNKHSRKKRLETNNNNQADCWNLNIFGPIRMCLIRPSWKAEQASDPLKSDNCDNPWQRLSDQTCSIVQKKGTWRNGKEGRDFRVGEKKTVYEGRGKRGCIDR